MQGYWTFVLSENTNCFYLGERIGEGVEREETGEGEGWIYSRYTQHKNILVESIATYDEHKE